MNPILLKPSGERTSRSSHGSACGRAGRPRVRPCHSFPGLTTNHLRVAVRDPADNQRLINALGEALEP